MAKGKWYFIPKKFLIQYWRTVLMFVLYSGIFAAVFFLYELETEAVLYAAVLCGLLTAMVLPVNFVFYWKAYDRRQRILRDVEIALDELPEPKSLTEADYQEMLRKLKGSYDANLTAWQNERQESMDYYTTWVHQIKTPISVMRMTLQGEDTEEHRELQAELFRIEQYVEMALNWIRLGGNASDFVFRECALDEIIRQAVRKYAPQFIRKRLRLSYEPTDGIVLTDEKWLLFIIEQVLSNAVKYTQKGGVKITVTQNKVLQIADTGIGIAPEDVPRIFEKGFTGYNGRADKKSTGLGLYLCRLTAERLSHRITVESAVGKGTVFSLDLHRDALEVE
nr:sensor histidine kinase [uncultured Acetatifactor sp.]